MAEAGSVAEPITEDAPPAPGAPGPPVSPVSAAGAEASAEPAAPAPAAPDEASPAPGGSSDDSCGVDLSYDPAYLELEQLIDGTPERQMGDTVIEAAEPDWREVRKQAKALLDKSKDLRIIMFLTAADLRIDGVPGLARGLTMLADLLANRWENVWPHLDPDDDNDPTERMNIISSLAPEPGAYRDPLMFPQRLREATICASRQLGPVTLRDLRIASGDLTPTDGAQPMDEAMIAAIFQDAPIEQLQSSKEAVDGCVASLETIDKALSEKVGPGSSPDLSSMKADLKEIQATLVEHLERRGYGASSGDDAGEGQGEADGAEGDGVTRGKPGQISSRADVTEAIDRICRYYELYEPSSPVPMILRRARRLVQMSFMEILKDVTPTGVDQAAVLFGQAEEEEPPKPARGKK